MARKAKGGNHDKDDDRNGDDDVEVVDMRPEEDAERDRGAVVSDQVEAIQHDAVAVPRQVPGQAYAGQATLELLETTDVEDIQTLSDALVEVIQGSAYDDMTWNEIDHALRRTSHAIRQNWAATGTVQPAPEVPPEDAPAEGTRGLAARDDEKDGLRSAEEKPRYAG